MKLSQVLLIGASVSFLANPNAFAGDTASTGKVANLLAVAGPSGAPNNADFRIYLSGVPVMCVGSVTDASWAYVNATDPNYKAVLATMMLAYAGNKTTTVCAHPAVLGSRGRE